MAGAPADKPARLVGPDEPVVVLGPPSPYVSRGGLKLEAALDRFDVLPHGRRALDAGASTGGFTDCLLQRGAARVYAVDVGHGQLDAGLRADPRVVVLERVNVRTLTVAQLVAADPAFVPCPLVVADLSFISLRSVLPALCGPVAADGADFVLLVKPQFEAGPGRRVQGQGRRARPRRVAGRPRRGGVRADRRRNRHSGSDGLPADRCRRQRRVPGARPQGRVGDRATGWTTSWPGPWPKPKSWSRWAGATPAEPGPRHGDRHLPRPPGPARRAGPGQRHGGLAQGRGDRARILRFSGPDRVDDDGRRRALGAIDLAGSTVAVSLGGDGTFLRIVRLATGTDVPVLGVNFGRLGYLPDLGPDQIRGALRKVFEGEATIESRCALEVAIADRSVSDDTSLLALNEVVIEKIDFGHTVRLATRIDGEEALTYSADGLIVATPTGSTAYNLSAGGPILAPTLRCMVVTPVAPHLSLDRSLVLSEDQEVRIEVVPDRAGALVIDGADVGPAPAGLRRHLSDRGQAGAGGAQRAPDVRGHPALPPAGRPAAAP